jgi:adenosylcobyric acid synthase
MIIIPGTKNTIGDLLYMRETGMEQRITDFARSGGMVAGICGGYQMLGRKIRDPFMVDGSVSEADGMGLLPVSTVMEKEKQTLQVTGKSLTRGVFGDGDVRGYEIHMGRTERFDGARPAFRVVESGLHREDGAVSADLRVWGTYLHGVFDSDSFRKSFLDGIRNRKGITSSPSCSYEKRKQEGFEKLAAIVRSNIAIEKLYEILRKE